MEYNKENGMDRLAAANLYLLGTNETHLYAINPVTNRALDINSKNIFGERISADIKNDTTYLLTLQKLAYGDTNSFRIEGQIGRGDFLSKIKKSTIQSNVFGKKNHFFILVT